VAARGRRRTVQPFSRSVRRALVTAVAVDLFVFLREHTGVDPLTALVARRLDDLAYGSGLWWGALCHRSPCCLMLRGCGSSKSASREHIAAKVVAPQRLRPL
jgi:hypothetical protein